MVCEVLVFFNVFIIEPQPKSENPSTQIFWTVLLYLQLQKCANGGDEQSPALFYKNA